MINLSLIKPKYIALTVSRVGNCIYLFIQTLGWIFLRQMTNDVGGLTNPQTEENNSFHGGDPQKKCKANRRNLTTTLEVIVHLGASKNGGQMLSFFASLFKIEAKKSPFLAILIPS